MSHWVFFTSLKAQENLIQNGSFTNPLLPWYISGSATEMTFSLIPDSGKNILQINIISPAQTDWDVQLLQQLSNTFNQNDVLFLRFSMSNPANDIGIYIQWSWNPWTKYAFVNIPKNASNKEYRIVFSNVPHDLDSGNLMLTMFMGSNIGTTEISNLSFLNLGPDPDISALNPTQTYDYPWGTQVTGDEWRAPALKRIDSLRRSPLTIFCSDSLGNPVSGAKVVIKQTRHGFRFGTAASDPQFTETNAGSEYLQKLDSLFNIITPENGLKWVDGGTNQYFNWMQQWAEQRNIPIRGHNLFWPAFQYCPSWLHGLPVTVMYDSIISHVKNYAQKYKGKVIHWDVINEAVGNTEAWQPIGIKVLVDCYKTVKSIDSSALLFYNDYGNIAVDSNQRSQVKSLVRNMIAQGAPIEAIGEQCHLGNQIVSPENVLTSLDDLSSLGLPIYITEMDMDPLTTPEFTASYYKDLFTVLFSHPAVHGILQWGFWAGADWIPDAAIFNLDWTPRLTGAAFEELMSQRLDYRYHPLFKQGWICFDKGISW